MTPARRRELMFIEEPGTGITGARRGGELDYVEIVSLPSIAAEQDFHDGIPGRHRHGGGAIKRNAERVGACMSEVDAPMVPDPTELDVPKNVFKKVAPAAKHLKRAV